MTTKASSTKKRSSAKVAYFHTGDKKYLKYDIP